MPDATIKIKGARFIVTMDPERRIIRNGSLVIRGQNIIQVGKTDDMTDVQADRVIDAKDMVVTPGFVNGHMHISYAHATRGIFPDDLGSAYLPNVFKLQAIMTEEEEYNTSLLAITELLKYGTTTFIDPGSTKYLDRCMDAYEQAGCRIIVGAHVTDRTNALDLPVSSTADAIQTIETTIERFDHKLDGRIRAWAMPFAPNMCTDELLLECKRLADHYNTGLTLHYYIVPNYLETLNRGISGMRLALITDLLQSTQVHHEVRHAVLEASNVLEGLGANLEEVSIPLACHATEIADVLRVEPGSNRLNYLRANTNQFGHDARIVLLTGAIMPAQYYYKVQRLRAMLRDQYLNVLNDYDAVICPTYGIAACLLYTSDAADE